MIRQVVFTGLLLAAATAWVAPLSAQGVNPAPRLPLPIPLSRLTPDAVVPVAMRPGSIESADAIWVADGQAGAIVRIAAADSKPGSPVLVGTEPCASLAAAFESVWVPLCGDGTLARVDAKTSTVTATLKTQVTSRDGRIAAGVGSIWAITDQKGVLSRIDPATNTVVAEIYVAGGAYAVAAGDEALWITSETGDVLTRVNAHNNEIVETIKVGRKPGPVALGEDGVWTLNRGDNTVTRVDPATNKVVATIALGDGAGDGEIAAGLGSVWVSAAGAPIIRIDPRSNRAVQRFTGEGGGALLVAHGSLWIAAGPRLIWRLDPMLVAATRP